MSRFSSGLVALALGVVLGNFARAQNPGSPPSFTVITVEKMHCESCAKRIAGKVYEVPGVDKIQVDVAKKMMWVHPKAGAQPSPRGLWEAVEKADDRPTQLHGPSGVFKAKPQS